MEGVTFSAQREEVPPIPTKPPNVNKNDNSYVTGGISFKDKVLDQKNPIPARGRRDVIAENLMTTVYEEGSLPVPCISLDDSLFKELCLPWQDALVITMVGKILNYHVLKEPLRRLWKLQGGFDMVDVDHSFYYVKLDHAADRETVICGGPWMSFDHYSVVSHWTPEFVAPTAKVDRTMVWVRFPGLNIIYYDESVLMGLAYFVGKPIKVDTNTLRADRGRYARVCVEIDLTKPVVGRYKLGGHSYKVMYEGLHVICKTCDCYGHVTRNCTKQPKPQNQPPNKPSEETRDDGDRTEKGEGCETVVELHLMEG